MALCLSQAGLVPPILDLNKLLDVLGRSAKQWPMCKAVYEGMGRLKVQPNKYTFMILAHSAAVAAPWAEVRHIGPARLPCLGRRPDSDARSSPRCYACWKTRCDRGWQATTSLRWR
jgi:hypothetical protein